MAQLRVPEIARRCGVSNAAVRRWILEGRLPVTRIGRTVSVDEMVIEKIIKDATTPALVRAGK